jgi:hypothetical protein
MADAIPAELRQADVNIWKCATKAAQLQAVKPIVSYWCKLSGVRLFTVTPAKCYQVNTGW